MPKGELDAHLGYPSNDKHEKGTSNEAVYPVIAHDPRGRKDVPGLWMADSVGARQWMRISGGLRGRGVEDVPFVSMDGPGGLEDGVHAVFPHAVVQRRIVHLAGSSVRFVPNKDRREFRADIKAVYGASSLDDARGAWEAFRSRWEGVHPGAVAVWERSEGHVRRLFGCGGEVRRIMYATNTVESVNASFRKVIKRGCFPDRDAVMKLPYLRVKELYAGWGTGCHQPGWPQVRSQLMCDDAIRPRIERYM